MSIVVRNPRTSLGAEQYAVHLWTIRSAGWTDLCDHAQGVYYGYAHTGQRTARQHWDTIPAELKYKDAIPQVGSLGFFLDEGVGQGHVVIAQGNGLWISTDFDVPDHITGNHTTEALSKWVGLPYVGNTAPYFPNAVGAIGPADKVWVHQTALPVVKVADVQPGMGPSLEIGLVQHALAMKNLYHYPWDRRFDGNTRRAYAKWQELLGYRGQDADGAPGVTSLTKLGTSTGLFRV